VGRYRRSRRDNREAIDACLKRAAKAKKAVRSTIRIGSIRDG